MDDLWEPQAEPRSAERLVERGGHAVASGGVEDDLSVLSIIAALLHRPRLLFGLPAAFGILAVAIALLRPVEYSATAKFGPQRLQRNTSQLAGLVARFGIDLGAGASMESTEFYSELLRSGHLLRETVLTKYRVQRGTADTAGNTATLLDIYRVRGETREDSILAAIDALERKMSVRVNPRSDLVTLEVRAGTPELAVQITRRILELVNEFNVSKRRSQAALESEFIAARLAEARAELEEAEASLKNFLQQNRAFEKSPELMVEHARLQRRVDFQLQVYTTLAQALETSRIEAVRNTPVITIVEPPEDSVRRVPRHLARNALLGLILGAGLSISLALLLDYLERQRRDKPDAYAELRQAGWSVLVRVLPGHMARRVALRAEERGRRWRGQA